MPTNENFRNLAEQAVDGKKGDLVRARALYDNVIDRMRYAKYGEGWGKGDALYACNARTGNCTDFHAYFIALARAVGIPARFAIGAALPSERNEGGIDGYHCWAEFFADGKWWPVDISEGNKYTSLSTYYFGHHPAKLPLSLWIGIRLGGFIAAHALSNSAYLSFKQGRSTPGIFNYQGGNFPSLPEEKMI